MNRRAKDTQRSMQEFRAISRQIQTGCFVILLAVIFMIILISGLSN
jgi:hypothetical protein